MMPWAAAAARRSRPAQAIHRHKHLIEITDLDQLGERYPQGGRERLCIDRADLTQLFLAQSADRRNIQLAHYCVIILSGETASGRARLPRQRRPLPVARSCGPRFGLQFTTASKSPCGRHFAIVNGFRILTPGVPRAFYQSALYPVLRHINTYLLRWVMNKYKKHSTREKAAKVLGGAAAAKPQYFAHWAGVDFCLGAGGTGYASFSFCYGLSRIVIAVEP